MSPTIGSAVFLSYASQDIEEARRIASALQAAGIEVWFDQTGLKGGATWDAEIRARIRDCALFMPIISINTQQRQEGYFRLEWRLAEQRTHLMVRGKPFLVPVVIDGTTDDGALVPDSFLDVQWTRLMGCEAAETLALHVKDLLFRSDTPLPASGSGPSAAATPALSRPATAAAGRKRNFIGARKIAAFAVVMTGIAVVFWGVSAQRTGQAIPADPGTHVSAPAAPRTAVAVLPFANLTGDASKEYLGDGMAEELINTLAKVKELKVPARTSTFAYKGRNTDVRQIARDLGVGTVLEGSVRAAGKRIRITAQLIDAQDGLHLWSESYDEEFTDIFKLQDKLATQIAIALQPSLGATVQATVAQGPPTADVQAYDLYLQGLDLLSRPSEPNLQRAIANFQQAIARDPKFARAYAGMAEAFWFLPGPTDQAMAVAVRLARQALAIDPQLGSAHSILATAAGWRLQLLDMEAHGRAALALGAGDSQIHVNRAVSMVNTGHVGQALAESQKAYALAPANLRATAMLAFAEALAGRDAEALRYADQAAAGGYPRASAPLPQTCSLLASHAGRFAEAAESWMAAWDKPFRLGAAARVVPMVSAAQADPGRVESALATRERFFPKAAIQSLDLAPDEAGNCMEAALWYASLGAGRPLDVAYDLANQCMDELVPGQIIMLPLMWTPERRPFRRDPRFQALATRLGLIEYWQQYGPPDGCELRDGRLTCH